MLPAALVALVLAVSPGAEQSFRDGRRLLQEGRVGEACQAFEESHRLDPALGALLNLAECEALLGHEAKAYALFQEVLGWSRRARHAEREQVALARLQDLRSRVALVVIDAPPSARVEIDGQPVVAGTQVALMPGTHQVVVTNGDDVRTQRLEVKAGELVAAKPAAVEKKVVILVPVPAPASAASLLAAPPPAPPPSRWKTLAGRGLLVGGAVALVAGIAGTAWSTSTWQQVERQRPGGPDYDKPTVTESEYRRAAVVYPVSVTAVAVGALASVGGGALMFSGSFQE